MNVSLTPELETLVQEKVKTGMYHSASEVVRAGLRLLQEQDAVYAIRLEELRREIQIGLDEINRGKLSRLILRILCGRFTSDLPP